MLYQTKIAVLIAMSLPVSAMAQGHLLLTEQTPMTSKPVNAGEPPFKTVHVPDEEPFRRIDRRNHRTPIGQATKKLLDEQASGTQAGPLRPTLGVTANLSWKRYLDSFTHPIPDTYETKIETE